MSASPDLSPHLSPHLCPTCQLNTDVLVGGSQGIEHICEEPRVCYCPDRANCWRDTDPETLGPIWPADHAGQPGTGT